MFVFFVLYFLFENVCGCVVGNVMSGLLLGIMFVWLIFSLVVDMWGWNVIFVLFVIVIIVLVFVLLKVFFIRKLKVKINYIVLFNLMW